MKENSNYTILIADDNPNNLKVLSSMLEKQGYQVRISTNGEQVLKSIAIKSPDLIMLDIHMPVLDGYDTCKKIKSDQRFRNIPVIFISAMSEAFNKILAFESGGIDYIVKPFQLEEVNIRVKTHLALKEFQMRQQYNLETIAHFLRGSKLEEAIGNIEQAYMQLCNGNTTPEHQKKHLDIIGASIKKVREIVVNCTSDIDVC